MYGEDCRITSPETGRPSPEALAAALARVGRSPRAARLTDLKVYCEQFTDDAARALIDAPRLTRLRRLDVSRVRLGKRTLAALEERFAAQL